jgi:hypothetical protein
MLQFAAGHPHTAASQGYSQVPYDRAIRQGVWLRTHSPPQTQKGPSSYEGSEAVAGARALQKTLPTEGRTSALHGRQELRNVQLRQELPQLETATQTAEEISGFVPIVWR